LAELKSKIADHNELSQFKNTFDDDLLIGFLHGKRYNINKSFECLKHFVYVRNKKYRSFTKQHVPSSVTLLDKHFGHMLKNKDEQGKGIAFIEMNIWEHHTVEEVMAAIVFYCDEAIRTYLKDSEENKLVIIFDCKGFGFSQARQVTPGVLMQGFELVQNSVPIRIAAIHLLNEGRLINMLVRIGKPFLKEKLRDRIFAHSDKYDSLHEHVPPSILPEYLGGHLANEEAYEDSMPLKIRNHESFYKRLGQKL